MDDPRRLRRLPALADRPRAGFLRAGGEVGLQPQGVEADAGELVESRLLLTGGCQQLRRVRGVEVDELRLDLRVEEDGLRGGDERFELGLARGIRQHLLVDVEDEDERLRGEQAQLADGCEVEVRRGQKFPALQSVARGDRSLEHRGVELLPTHLLLVARDRLLERLEVGQLQLGVDRLHVAARIHRTVDVHDVVVGEATDDLGDRVGLADVREELVAEPLTLAGAAHDAGDVDERDRGGKDPLRTEHLGELLEPRIGQVHHADVRLDRRERIVRGEHVVLGQSVEQGRLADVGETDDSDGKSHGRPV